MRKGLIVIVLAIGVACNLGMTPWYDTLFKAKDQQSLTATAVMLDALGELRTALAKNIYFQTDLYHHEMEEQKIIWTQERDLMAMYKMVTMLDPRFIEAYDIASYQLVENFKKPEEGLAYLDEGLQNNPDSALLHFDKAFLLQHLKRYQEAVAEANKAMVLYAPDPVALLQADPTEQIDFLNACRVMAQSYEAMGNKPMETHLRRIMLMLRPDDDVAKRRLTEMGQPAVPYTPAEFLKTLHN